MKAGRSRVGRFRSLSSLGAFGRVGLAGSRPGGRLTFLLRGKKVSKEARPASPVGLRPTALRCSERRAAFANSPCGLGQRSRTTPAAPALLGGEEGRGVSGSASPSPWPMGIAALGPSYVPPVSVIASLVGCGDGGIASPSGEGAAEPVSRLPSVVPTGGVPGRELWLRCLSRAAASLRSHPAWNSAGRAARRATTAGHVSLPAFLSCNKKAGRPPGRVPANATPPKAPKAISRMPTPHRGAPA
jgi:hypothetical protein